MKKKMIPVRFYGFLLGAIWVVACREKSAAEQAEPSSSSVALPPSASVAAAVAPSSLAEESFALKLSVPTVGKVGAKLPVHIELEPRAGYKVNEEYPLKFTFDVRPGIDVTPSTLRGENGQISAKKAELHGEVAFAAPGSQLLSGRLAFSVCTEERCLIEKRDLGATIVVD